MRIQQGLALTVVGALTWTGLGAAERTDETDAEEVLTEVVVTGSHIRGAPPVGVDVITVTQEEIRKGGFTRIEEVLRSLPQNFGGGAREETYGNTDIISGINISTSNFTKGTTVNLRGLSAGATLVLVNGRRLAPSGDRGLFTDVSTLPLGAVERIEILAEGASALYGSDAVGGVVNIILNKDFSGAETSLRAGAGAGGTNDYQLTQLLGMRWDGGNAMLSYEFTKRDELRAASRWFSADSDQRRNGGDNFSSPGGNPGVIMDLNDGRTWAIPPNQNGQGLTPESFVEGSANYQNEAKYLWLLPEQQRHSVTASVSHDLSDRVTLWGQGLGGWRNGRYAYPYGDAVFVPTSNPWYVNPTGGTDEVVVFYDFTKDFGGVYGENRERTLSLDVGTDVRLGARWKLTADIARSEERGDTQGDVIDRNQVSLAAADSNPATALNVFGDGVANNPATIDKLRALTFARTDSNLTAINLLAEGPVMTWAGGDIRLAAGSEYRKFEFSSSRGGEDSTGRSQRFSDSKGRNLTALFAELRIPVFGESNRRLGLYDLALSAAVRREDYSDFGESTVPKFGISWSPVRALGLRATWSRAFRAPDLSSLSEEGNSFSLRTIADPQAPSGRSRVLFWSGGNAGLKSETADQLTAGFDLEVPVVTGLRFSATYFDIKFEDRIGSPFAGGSTNNALSDQRYAQYAVRGFDSTMRERVCSGSSSSTSQQLCLTESIAAIVDARTTNTALLATNGVDVNVDYLRTTSFGTVGGGISATRIFTYEHSTSVTADPLSLLNRLYSPVDTRFRATAFWRRGPWGITGYLNHVDGYKDVDTAGTPTVASWNTIDVDMSWKSELDKGVLQGISIALNARNLFNRDPPWVNTMFGYDSFNADPYGRMVSVVVRKQWR